MFDTLAYATKLKAAGFTEQQAKAQAEALVSVVNENLATKEDLAELKVDIIKWMVTMAMAQTALVFGIVKLFAS